MERSKRMNYRSAHLTDSGFTLHYLDSREPQKYQVHEINAEWKDWQTRFKLRNEL